jgi:hypothetical protein
VTKWIFAICIILSYVFLIYRWIRAWRVIRSGSVAESYLEPLAAVFQSIRLGKNGQGWRRFLVFAELTKSRKGVDYLALFTYFQFKGALIVIVAQGPRIAINAITLWAVMQANLIPVGAHAAPKNRSKFVQFFMNIEIMAKTGNKQETVIYFTMLFSLIIWVIAALSLLLSVLFYLFFLWHHIPSSDGTLTRYCRRKINARLERIVNKKVRKAIEKQDLKRRREEAKALKNGDVEGSTYRAPTLPKLGGDDDTTSLYSVSTMTTLPPYSANGMTRNNTTSTTTTMNSSGMKQPTLPSLSERPMPSRSETQATYASDAGLLGQAEEMGMSSPSPPMPPLDRNDYFYGSHGPPGPRAMPNYPNRSYSAMSYGRVTPAPPRGPLLPVDTSFPGGRNTPSPPLVSPLENDHYGLSREPYYPNHGPDRPQLGNPAFSPYDGRDPALGDSYDSYELSPVDTTPPQVRPFHYASDSNASNASIDYRTPQLPNVLRSGSPAPAPSMNNGYAPQPPLRSGTAPPNNPRAGIPAALQSAIQRREASQPLPRGQGPMGSAPQQRSATAPLRQPGWGNGPIDRSNTTTPGQQSYNRY